MFISVLNHLTTQPPKTLPAFIAMFTTALRAKAVTLERTTMANQLTSQ